MKTRLSILTAILFSLFTFSVKAQQHEHEHTGPAVTTKKPALSQTLSLYYEIKNALINGDATVASAKAAAFTTAINAADMSTLKGNEMEVFMSSQKKLAAAGNQLTAEKNIQKQREAFATLSSEMAILVKGVKFSVEPVYQFTCPMKKASWLSSETTVKNPYYGKQMLTCGKLTETIK